MLREAVEARVGLRDSPVQREGWSCPPEIHALACYVTRRAGGHGALREVADLVLAARGARAAILGRLVGEGSDA